MGVPTRRGMEGGCLATTHECSLCCVCLPGAFWTFGAVSVRVCPTESRAQASPLLSIPSVRRVAGKEQVGLVPSGVALNRGCSGVRMSAHGPTAASHRSAFAVEECMNEWLLQLVHQRVNGTNQGMRE